MFLCLGIQIHAKLPLVENILTIEIGNGRGGCLMVSAVNSGSRVPGSSPGGRLCAAFSLPQSTQVYTWVPANLMVGVNMPWTSIPSMEWQKNSSPCQ